MREKLRNWWYGRFSTEHKARQTVLAILCFWGAVLFFVIWIPYNHYMLAK